MVGRPKPATVFATASGADRITASNMRAARSGRFLPCSQSRTVPIVKPNLTAKACCVSPRSSLTERTSMLGASVVGPGPRVPRFIPSIRLPMFFIRSIRLSRSWGKGIRRLQPRRLGQSASERQPIETRHRPFSRLPCPKHRPSTPIPFQDSTQRVHSHPIRLPGNIGVEVG